MLKRSSPFATQQAVKSDDTEPVSPELEVLARLMDSAFELPGVGLRFGLDPLLGLVPGLGDALTSLVSMYILHTARRHGASRLTLMRMAANVAIDFAVGAIPLAGDAFDLIWKANEKNVTLLRRHLRATPAEARRAKASDWLFMAVLFAGLAAMLVGSAFIAYTLISWVGHWMFPPARVIV